MVGPIPTQSGGGVILRWLCGLYCLIGLAFLVVWPLSFQHYSTVGVEQDTFKSANRVSSRYYRLRWPGDGSVRIGGGGYTHPPALDTLPTESYHLTEHFLDEPRREIADSFLNKVGFWWQSSGTAFNHDGNPWQYWVGVPSFLPGIFFGWLALRCWRRLHRPALR